MRPERVQLETVTEGGHGGPGGHGGHGGHDETPSDPHEHMPSAGSLRRVGFIGIGVIVGLVVLGVVPRLIKNAQEKAELASDAAEAPRVVVTKPMKNSVTGGIPLSAGLQAVQETVLYARTNGYIRGYKVDIGDHVKEGQELARIDTPEVDQELAAAQASQHQAEAAVQQAKTQLELARVENGRYAGLATSGVVSKEEGESRKATFDVQGANLQAAEAALGSASANVRRLQELEKFKTVVAPFDGVVTSRTIEVGQLVTAGSAQGQAIFKVAKTDVMRVFVAVPQIYAPSVKTGDTVKVHVREFPQRNFEGKITRSASELDPATRTLLTEIRIENTDGALLPGMYAEVTMGLNRTDGSLLIPATALVVNADGSRVALVENNKVRWQTVQVDADMGDKVSVSGGVNAESQVVVTPGDRLLEGMSVAPATTNKT